MAHGNIPQQESQIINNLELVGARTSRHLKDSRPPPQPMFARKMPPTPGSGQEDLLLSRFEPVLQTLLEAHSNNNVDATSFPYTKPPLDLGMEQSQVSATSLRSAKPTWAKTRTNVSAENRQRRHHLHGRWSHLLRKPRLLRHRPHHRSRNLPHNLPHANTAALYPTNPRPQRRQATARYTRRATQTASARALV